MTVHDLWANTLKLLEGMEDPECKNLVSVWTRWGLQDVHSSLRAWWAVRIAKIVIEEDGMAFLPPSYLEMSTFAPWGGGEPLDPISSDQVGSYLGQSGPAKKYLLAGTQIMPVPIQTVDTEYFASYYSTLEPLVATDDTNLYAERAEAAIVYAAAAHGAIHRGEVDMAIRFRTVSQERINAINEESPGGRSGTGIVVMRGKTRYG